MEQNSKLIVTPRFIKARITEVKCSWAIDSSSEIRKKIKTIEDEGEKYGCPTIVIAVYIGSDSTLFVCKR